jgi:hypothetical protein
VPDPVPLRRWSVPALEAAIVAAELRLTEHRTYLELRRTFGRDTSVAETLVRSAELCLETLWQERDWRLVHEKDGHA